MDRWFEALKSGALHEFSRHSAPEMTEAVKGKVVATVEVPDSGLDDWLIFRFTDGTSLQLRYDWIYEWCITEAACES